MFCINISLQVLTQVKVCGILAENERRKVDCGQWIVRRKEEMTHARSGKGSLSATNALRSVPPRFALPQEMTMAKGRIPTPFLLQIYSTSTPILLGFYSRFTPILAYETPRKQPGAAMFRFAKSFSATGSKGNSDWQP